MTPDEFTNQEFFLDVGDGHHLYVQDWGTPDAQVPILFLHGGPGNGCDDRDKAKFDPRTQRVIFHDQRGSGKSTPTGSLERNTSQDLVNDIDKLSKHLGLDKFVLTGGSWGSTLALVYGIAHPDKVAGMVVDGIFTATQEEAEWFEQGGWRDFFPDTWETYQATVPAAHRGNPSAYHYKQALGNDAEATKRAAYDYLGMELAILKLDDQYMQKPYDGFEPGGGLIEMHYLAHGCFLPEGHIPKNAAKLTMPVYLVQGRYDMVCRPKVAYELDKALPNSKLIWTINGHLKQHEAKTVLNLLLDQLTGGA
ncbi:MAG TPA: alpha/beta fold hydrolase [Candidatus Saccharimonadales bacterium]|nr:alpha/beta fold hydrolase [Candidatus Saccharimonadales bacterium]